MLSNENKTMPTEEQTAAAWQHAAQEAKRLGHQLVRFERNENPQEHLNAPNPATAGVRIRLLGRPRPPIRIGYDVDSVRAHNDAVASFGREGRFTS